MDFRIADTFTDSLAKLTGDEQKAAKTTAFDLQVDASAPGLSFHKLDRAKDKNFLSVRVNRDIRLIVHRTAASLLLCYVNHHDAAYRWAERRKIERHPKTGAAQLVEIRETVRSVDVQRGFVREASTVPAYAAKPPPFAGMTDDELLAHGVPPEWLDEVRNANEDSFARSRGSSAGRSGRGVVGACDRRYAGSALASGARRGSVRPPGRATAIPHRGERRGTGARP